MLIKSSMTDGAEVCELVRVQKKICYDWKWRKQLLS